MAGDDAFDGLNRVLREHGVKTRPYCLPNSSLVVGEVFQRDGYELVFRLEENQILILVAYRRIRARQGLANPFRILLWFMELLCIPESGVRTIKALPLAPVSGKGPRLSTQQLYAFYRHYLGGRPAEHDGEPGWLALDVVDFCPLGKRSRGAAR